MTKERKAINILEKLDLIKQLERGKRIPKYLPRSCLRDNTVKNCSAKLGTRVSVIRISY